MRGSRLAIALCALLGAAPGAASAEEPAGRVVLRWQSVPGAAGYDLQVATDPSFARRTVDLRVELAGYRLVPAPEQRCYWRVRTVDADGRPGPWSTAKTIEPPGREPAPSAVEAPPPPVEAQALEPAPLAGGAPAADESGPAFPPIAARAGELPAPIVSFPEEGFEGASPWAALWDGRPGALVGWRANLLGVDAPQVGIEGTWPLTWLGGGWSGALRVGWWRERATVRVTGAPALGAAADVFPLSVILLRSFDLRRVRLYAGAGLGADLVVVRLPDQGALEASAAARVLAGAGRRLGPGEAFAEVEGGLGGVDGPLGRLRTGGLSLSLGYRLSR
jgi:hypothetical protein